MKKNLNQVVKVLGLMGSLLGAATGCNGAGAPNSTASTSSSSSTQTCTGNSQFVGANLVGANPLRQANNVGAKLKTIHAHPASENLTASDQGKSEETQEIAVSVSLALPNSADLEQEISAIYEPGNPKFHQFLSAEQFHDRFAPTTDQLNAVITHLQSQGLHSFSVDGNGMLVHAVGSVASMNNAFHTEIHDFKDAQGVAYRAPVYDVQVQDGLAIEGVHGLENKPRFHTHLKKSEAVKPHGATGQGGGFSPSDIRTAYNIPTTVDGSGQALGLFELDGYAATDIAAYETQYGLPSATLQNVLVDGATGTPGGGEAEVTLDIELMIAIAPKAAKIMVYEGPNDNQGSLDTYSKIASDNIAKSISSSWGSSESSEDSAFLQSENTIFMEMAAQGQTIFSAAGDSGADDNGSSLSIDDPSGQPYVTAVGGTSLTTNSAGARVTETTWEDSSGGGGGGISTVWTIPSWQTSSVSSASKGSTTMRNIPDVALNADIATGYSIYTSGSWGVWGGTSCAAPLWAAFNALVNQQRASNGLSTSGFLNPLLYAVGKSNRYASDFYDIADGSTNGYYPAVTGLDDATGWGALNGVELLKDLSGEPTPGSTIAISPIAACNS